MRTIRRKLPVTGRGLFHDWGPSGLAALESRLARGHETSGDGRPGGLAALLPRLARVDEISVEELALAIEQNPDVPLPPGVRDAVVRHLRGELKRKRGPKPEGLVPLLRDYLAGRHYASALRAFTRVSECKKRKAKATRIIPPRGEESPSERALHHTAREFEMDPGTLRNRLSRAGFLSNSRSRQRR